MTGKSEKDILDKGIQVALCENSLEVINEQLKKAFSGTLCSEKCEYVGKNDVVVTVIQSFKPVFNEDTNSVKAVKSVALLELDT